VFVFNVILAAFCVNGCGKRQAEAEKAADLVLKNGMVETLDNALPRVTALAVKGGLIVARGDETGIGEWIGKETRVIDLHGCLVVPGLIEAHAHLLSLGRTKTQIDLTGTRSAEDIAAMVEKAAAEADPGKWILGRGWDQNDWEKKRFPGHALLTDAAPENPVYLTRIDGHAAWVNMCAMELAGLKRESGDPDGGKIIRDSEGVPTGVLIDNAESLVSGKIPPLSRDEMKKAVLAGLKSSVENGITGFHDAGAGAEVISIYREILGQGKLPLRLYVMLANDDELVAEYFENGPCIGEGGGLLTIRALKLFADGALGSRGAALLDPYTDDPGNSGLIVTTEEEIFDRAEKALAAGFQVCTHAIGDRANRIVLNAYERALEAVPDATDDHRFRIEHAQILDRSDIPRFVGLGVIPSMQPTHCTSDMTWVHTRLGKERAEEGAYVWKKLLHSGARIPAGSDAPVESINPLLGFYAAVTRQDRDGNPPGGWYPEQRMSREEALRAFTMDAAYAAFEEKSRGSIEKGKLADLTVLDRDIMKVPADQILETKVVMTVTGGEIVYSRDIAE